MKLPEMLLQLTLAGSITFLLVALVEWRVAGRMKSGWRRIWWVLVAASFLIPPFIALPVPQKPIRLVKPPDEVPSRQAIPAADPLATVTATTGESLQWKPILLAIWAAGAGVSLGFALAQSWRTSRRWRSEPLCTDSGTLALLEETKQIAGVTIPFGVITGREVGSPALLGWLRPRLLLPENQPRETLRAVFFHELAHVRAGDIPMGWLFLLVRSVHWFNPLAHLALAGWSRFREEAADEDAIAWMSRGGCPDAPHSYGEALINTLRHASSSSPALPGGALALGENFLKQRISMITRTTTRLPRPFLGLGLSLLLIAGVGFRPGYAETPMTSALDTPNAKSALATYPDAIRAMEAWLADIDGGKYAQSWKAASAYFRKELSEPQWVAALTQVRKPLGTCTERNIASAQPMEILPGVETVTVTFHSVFQGLPEAKETVSFNKEEDGKWRASGYFIHPR